jgi:hypothetical protein
MNTEKPLCAKKPSFTDRPFGSSVRPILFSNLVFPLNAQVLREIGNLPTNCVTVYVTTLRTSLVSTTSRAP